MRGSAPFAALTVTGLVSGLLLPPPAGAQVGSPAGPVPVERLAARRAALLDSIGMGVAILRSAEVRSLDGDYPQDGEYREDNDFFYLTGLEAPGGWLVLVARPDTNVFTVEPGIYIPEEGLGIRIEDDVLVTATGGEVLSAGIPRSAGEVEGVLRGR